MLQVVLVVFPALLVALAVVEDQGKLRVRVVQEMKEVIVRQRETMEAPLVVVVRIKALVVVVVLEQVEALEAAALAALVVLAVLETPMIIKLVQI